MTAIAYTQFRQHVADVVENLIHDGEPVVITRADGKNLVLLTAEEWESLSETSQVQC
jgi:prevent-host-death family protein